MPSQQLPDGTDEPRARDPAHGSAGPASSTCPGASAACRRRGRWRAGGRILRRWLPSRERTAAWLERHPVVASVLDRTGCLHPDRRTLARGVAVGMFVGLSPTVGFQTGLMLLGCMLVRGNFPAAFLVSWISNPVTIAPLYLAFNRLGEAAFGEVIGPDMQLGGAGGPAAELLYLLLGSLLIAGPIAGASYLVFLGAWRAVVMQRRRTPLRARPRARHRE